ncbi:uncharacterized protein [Ptychodera flava]|uniref:uncharacterized protein n=1 Tax=Ptychodera flava TaxID=63121 RepID=UPI00396A685A
MQVLTSQIQSFSEGCCRDYTPVNKPTTQMYIYLGQADGTTLPIPLKTVPAEEGNAIVAMIPTNTTKVNSNDSKDIESLRDDVDIDASESSPLLDRDDAKTKQTNN